MLICNLENYNHSENLTWKFFVWVYVNYRYADNRYRAITWQDTVDFSIDVDKHSFVSKNNAVCENNWHLCVSECTG